MMQIELDHLTKQQDGSYTLKPKPERKSTKRCGSPMEVVFFNAAYLDPDLRLLIKKQYKIGKYTVDFALPAAMIVIEIDGHRWHHTKTQRQADLQRQRDLQEQGWQVIRFTGSEVYQDVLVCLAQLKRIMKGQDKNGR